MADTPYNCVPRMSAAHPMLVLAVQGWRSPVLCGMGDRAQGFLRDSAFGGDSESLT